MSEITRRQLIELALASGACSGFLRPKIASALSSDSSDLVPFSEDVAAQIARNFSRTMEPELALEVGNVIPTLDIDGNMKGYYVAYLLAGSEHGYVSFNVDYPGLIASYSLATGARGQAGRLLNDMSSDVPRVLNRSTLVIMDPFTFGICDEYSGKVVSQAYERDASQALLWRLRQRAEWNDVLISRNEIDGGGYTLGGSKYSGELAYITEGMSERGCKRYACGPHALYVIGAALPNDAQTAPIIPNATSDWSCYAKLWDYTETRTHEKLPNGVIRGTTASNKLGPGFVRLCSERATTMRYSFESNPSFLSLVSHINNIEVAVIGAGIKTAEGDSGHFMATNGYAYLHRKSDNSVLQCAIVFDGWEDQQFFNFDFPSYIFKNMTFLYRKK